MLGEKTLEREKKRVCGGNRAGRHIACWENTNDKQGGRVYSRERKKHKTEIITGEGKKKIMLL